MAAAGKRAGALAKAGRWLAAALLLACAGAANAASVYAQAGPWIDDRNQPVTLAQWSGRNTVLTMAYGACRKICTTTLWRLEEIQALADKHGLALEFVVVSLDPKSDTPEAWADYRRSRRLARANWHFLSGSEAQTRRIGNLLGIKYWVYDDHVLHDFKVALVGPKGDIARELDWRNQDKLAAFLGVPVGR